MLPRSSKLNRQGFKELSRQNTRTTVNYLGSLRFCASKENKFSVVVSAKHSKLAVLRNKAKRRAYNLAREIIKNHSQKITGVLYFSKAAYKLPFLEFRTLLKELFEKVYGSFK